MTTYGKLNGVFGIPAEIKPIVGLPEGRARLRLSHEDFAQVFVKTANGIRRFFVSDVGQNWIAEIEIESNTTIQ